MKIIKGKVPGAKKVVIYGPEGIGKSTFASKFPDAVFIDTEGSTKDMDVARTEKPSSWTMLLNQLTEVINTPGICKTLIVDTIDWAEQMCIEHICAKHNKNGIESFGYGNGYVYVKAEFGRFLNRLEDVISSGVNVVLTAHAQMRKFEQPDEMGAYDRYELKLGKKTQSQTSPLVKEWADMVLFANYKTFAVAVDDQGKKHKAQGGKRVMYTTHHPCWDAKNRYGLPPEMDFDYAGIAFIIEPNNVFTPAQNVDKEPVKSKQVNKPAPVTPPGKESAKTVPDITAPPTEVPKATVTPAASPQASEERKEYKDPPAGKDSIFYLPETIPKSLRDLMYSNVVFEEEIRKVVARRGYYPFSTPIENYDPSFVEGCLVAAWDKVFDMIKESRDVEDEVPFN